MSDTKGQLRDTSIRPIRKDGVNVLDKIIFSKVFEKDIRRAYIYKKTERVAKALHLLSPAFAERPALAKRLDEIALSLVEAAALSPVTSRTAITRQLLSLSSFLSVAVSSALISSMNSDILADEIEGLLQEISLYEEPSLQMDDGDSLAELYRKGREVENTARREVSRPTSVSEPRSLRVVQAQTEPSKRQEQILKIIKDKKEVEIKDISTVLRDVSEKTIQRELQVLVGENVLIKEGERRWTRYRLAD